MVTENEQSEKQDNPLDVKIDKQKVIVYDHLVTIEQHKRRIQELGALVEESQRCIDDLKIQKEKSNKE